MKKGELLNGMIGPESGFVIEVCIFCLQILRRTCIFSAIYGWFWLKFEGQFTKLSVISLTKFQPNRSADFRENLHPMELLGPKNTNLNWKAGLWSSWSSSLARARISLFCVEKSVSGLDVAASVVKLLRHFTAPPRLLALPIFFSLAKSFLCRKLFVGVKCIWEWG